MSNKPLLQEPVICRICYEKCSYNDNKSVCACTGVLCHVCLRGEYNMTKDRDDEPYCTVCKTPYQIIQSTTCKIIAISCFRTMVLNENNNCQAIGVILPIMMWNIGATFLTIDQIANTIVDDLFLLVMDIMVVVFFIVEDVTGNIKNYYISSIFWIFAIYLARNILIFKFFFQDTSTTIDMVLCLLFNAYLLLSFIHKFLATLEKKSEEYGIIAPLETTSNFENSEFQNAH